MSSALVLTNVMSPSALTASSRETRFAPPSVVLPTDVVVRAWVTMPPPAPSLMAPLPAVSCTVPEVSNASSWMSEATVMVLVPPAVHGPLTVTLPMFVSVALPAAFRPVTSSTRVLLSVTLPAELSALNFETAFGPLSVVSPADTVVSDVALITPVVSVIEPAVEVRLTAPLVVVTPLSVPTVPTSKLLAWL